MIIRNTSQDMKTLFYAKLDGRFVEKKPNFEERNIIERIKSPRFLQAVLVIETM